MRQQDGSKLGLIASVLLLPRSAVRPVVSARRRSAPWVALLVVDRLRLAESLLVSRLVVLGQLYLELAAQHSVHPPLARLELLLLRLVLVLVVLEIFFRLDLFLDLDETLDSPRSGFGLLELDPAETLALACVFLGCLKAHVAYKDLATGIDILLLLRGGLSVLGVLDGFSLFLGSALEGCRILDEEFSATEVILGERDGRDLGSNIYEVDVGESLVCGLCALVSAGFLVGRYLDTGNHLFGDDASRVVHKPLAHRIGCNIERQVTNPDTVL
ncbi:hypothetical protein HG530_013484 [Fusarium avenaceum]|nr:hypothetical protein HG530_013484 [Fusarium avenaceum]